MKVSPGKPGKTAYGILETLETAPSGACWGVHRCLAMLEANSCSDTAGIGDSAVAGLCAIHRGGEEGKPSLVGSSQSSISRTRGRGGEGGEEEGREMSRSRVKQRHRCFGEIYQVEIKTKDS